ncbi:MAG: lysine exporter LysO family protein [Breznakibacter sp.]|nr:lysine exporter LysO family protein [Breznakibacter sp.]
MKGTLVIVLCFVAGIGVSYFLSIPEWSYSSGFQTAVLALLLFLVGVGIGSEDGLSTIFSNLSPTILLLPFLIIIGSLLGGFLATFFISNISSREGVAIASGMGYYSLSSILLSKLSGEQVGAMALIANLFREVSTILLFPIIAKAFGRFGGIASGGATSMDTTLPLIVRYSGKEMAVVAIYTGLVITMLVPLLISVIMS